MQSHDAERLFGGFIDGDKSHRARIVEIDQSGDELMREFLDRIEEAKPQIFLAHMSQMIADQVLIVRSDRPDKYPPALPEDDMPLPLRRVRTNANRQMPLLGYGSSDFRKLMKSPTCPGSSLNSGMF